MIWSAIENKHTQLQYYLTKETNSERTTILSHSFILCLCIRIAMYVGYVNVFFSRTLNYIDID